MVPLVIIAVLVVIAIFAPYLSPHDAYVGNLRVRNVPPAWQEGGDSTYPLGTDPLGRDIMVRVFFGARISLMIAGIVLSIGGLFGCSLGLVSGYLGGTADELIMRFVDLSLAVPFILVAMVTVVVFGQSFTMVIALLTLYSWSHFARQVRGEALSLKTRDYVALARVAGASPFRILFMHMLPGVLNTVLVVATLRVGTLILTEATLSFLGVGIPPPTPAWGLMVADGRNYVKVAWWVCFMPGVAIVLTVLAFNFLGDWLRDYFDPKLRQL